MEAACQPGLKSAGWVVGSGLVPYSLALLLVALTTALLNLVKDFVNPAVVALLYLLPVGASTALWGLGPGVLAAFTAFLAFNYFFIPPYFTLLVHQTQDFLELVVFLGVAVVLSQLLGRTRRSLAEATARDLSRGSQLRNHCVDCHDPHVPKYPTFEPIPGPRDRTPGSDGDHP